MTTLPGQPRPGIGDRLAALIRHRTVSATLDESGPAPFRAFEAALEDLYPLAHETLQREHITPFGLLYRWPGADATRSAVLMAHYDVVPADAADRWRHRPFDGVIADGWVHGRGALDDKGPLVVILEAVENLIAAGFTPPHDVYVALGGNEEVYGDAARTIAQTLHERAVRPWLVLDEGGAVVDAPLPFVSGQSAMVGVAEKGVMTLRLTAEGDGGHASAPRSVTAVGRVARAVSRLTPGTFPARTPAAVTGMLRSFADRTAGPARLLYRLLARSPRLTARVFRLAGGEPAALVRTTVAPTTITGGSAANVLPSRAEATINLRIALSETTHGTVQRVRRRIRDRRVTADVVEASEPSPESPATGPAFAAITAAVEASHPGAATVPYVMMAATDSRFFHRYFPAVYRFAPLTMSAAQRASIHGVDEAVEITALERGELFHRALLSHLPAAPADPPGGHAS